MLWKLCDHYLKDKHSSEEFWKLLRSMKILWHAVIGVKVRMCFENGEITIDPVVSSPTIRKESIAQALTRKRRALGETAIYLQTLYKLERDLSKLTEKQLEAVFWRHVDDSESCIDKRRNGMTVRICRPPSNSELAAHLGITEAAFRKRLLCAAEALGMPDAETMLFYQLRSRVI